VRGNEGLAILLGFPPGLVFSPSARTLGIRICQKDNAAVPYYPAKRRLSRKSKGFWTLDTLKKMLGQVCATGADLVLGQDEQDLQDFWRRSRLFHPVNLVHPVQKSSLVSIYGTSSLVSKV